VLTLADDVNTQFLMIGERAVAVVAVVAELGQQCKRGSSSCRVTSVKSRQSTFVAHPRFDHNCI